MNDRDDVGRLIQLAGKRRPVPPHRAERVKVTARQDWRREVRGRSRRRHLAAAAGLAAAVVLAAAMRVFWSGAGGPDVAPVGPYVVEALAGSAWSRVLADETSRALAAAAGDRIAVGSEFKTGHSGRAAVRLASGHSVRLDLQTIIRVLEDGSLALDQGAIYIDSGIRAGGAGDGSRTGVGGSGALDVHTPFGVVREVGTQFEVRLEESNVRVRLREGAVMVRQGDQSHEVLAGTELYLGVGGSVTRSEISPYEAAWDWIAGVTPMPDVENRTVQAFLEWVARERGWTLSYADESVARAAGEITLSGMTSLLTLDEALEAVLLTSRMTHRVQDGSLMIDAVP